jgi:hypothetical protein
MGALFRSSPLVESVVAVALMIAPAAIAWATGQTLLRLRDDADFWLRSGGLFI